jgi:hypothetical protein
MNDDSEGVASEQGIKKWTEYVIHLLHPDTSNDNRGNSDGKGDLSLEMSCKVLSVRLARRGPKVGSMSCPRHVDQLKGGVILVLGPGWLFGDGGFPLVLCVDGPCTCVCDWAWTGAWD